MSKKQMPEKDIVSSFNSALEGLIYAIRKERNLKIHFFFAFFVIIGSLFLSLPLAEFLLLLIVITLVLIAELFNTVVELAVDVLTNKYNEKAKRIKDVAASAVLISAVSSVLAGYLIFAKYFPEGWRNIFVNILESEWYFTIIALFIITSISIGLKFALTRKFSLSGGMPSIHSMIAFSIWAGISFLTFYEYPIISILVFILAFWVAQSRILRKIHNLEEVVIGGLLGLLFTTLIFQLLWR